MKQCNLLWVDLEMTGLDPDHDVILEIAVIATDIQLKTLIEGPSLVIHQSEQKLAKMNNWVREQHAKTGLVDKVRVSDVTLEAAEQQVLDFIEQHCVKDELYFAGNSVYVDRAFLRHYMPKLDQRANYRLIDVSTIKVLVQNWYPNDPKSDFHKKDMHRAIDDIRESIAELQQYRTAFFT